MKQFIRSNVLCALACALLALASAGALAQQPPARDSARPPASPPQVLPPLLPRGQSQAPAGASAAPVQDRTPVNPAPGANPATGSDEEYKLGVGDVLRITVYDQPDLLSEGEISGNGTVSMALVGDVAVAGKTRAQAAAILSDALKRGGFLKEANVIVRVLEYRSQQVAVLGEVAKPGRYPISRPSTVAELIAVAGGITPKGSQVVTVTQTGTGGEMRKQEVNVNDQINQGAGKALMLRAGDTIFVPGAPMFYVYGEVKLPGSYPVSPDMTVMQALSLGGGLTSRGTERGILLERRAPNGTVRTFSVRGQDKIQPNDVIRVQESWF
jgi:polysaccharide export outer membrane protein